MGRCRGDEVLRNIDSQPSHVRSSSTGGTSRCVVGGGNGPVVRKRLLPRKDRSGETDQGIFRPVLHRARNAVLRVPERAGRYFHEWQQGALATRVISADGRRGCRKRGGPGRGGSAGKWHYRDSGAGTVPRR